MMETISFDLGQIVATPGALEALERVGRTPNEYLQRHIKGDWGDLDAEDKLANAQSLIDGSRIMSSYFLPDETKLWIITDAEIDEQHHRQATTLLLPDEY